MGFGTLALSGVMEQELLGSPTPLYPKVPHFAPRAKHVIFLYMDGGVSQVDSFDPKPQLAKEHGQPPKFAVDATVFNNNGNLLKSPWEFNRYGESGLPISDLFPHIGSCADDLCVVRSMTAFSPNHPNANYALHSGHVLSGRPSMGAWVSYGLGTLSQNLPSYVVIHGGQVPAGGMQNFANGFLPANHQGSIFLNEHPVLQNTSPLEKSAEIQKQKLRFLHEVDGNLEARLAHAEAIESAIQNYELAARMQLEVPDVTDISKESEATKKLYGLDAPYENTRTYAAQCLMARRLVEKGTRFVQIFAGGWDSHDYLERGHSSRISAVDKPWAALIKDLKQRGMLDDTLVIWNGEFGRTPDNNMRGGVYAIGRGHNADAMTVMMAGGGIKKGAIVGATDEIGAKAVDIAHPIRDFHVTLLHLLGLDDNKLTYFHAGRYKQLSQFGGTVIKELIS